MTPEQRKEYAARHYQKNKAKYRSSMVTRRKERRQWLEQQKVGQSCKICGNSDIRVLEFHHRDKTQKEFNIYAAAHFAYSVARLLREIAKCDILCSNCHKIIHYEETKLRDS